MAKNSLLDYSTTPANNADIAGIGIQGTNAVNNFDDAFRTLMAQMRSDLDYKQVYTSKSANYTAVANDNNAFLTFSGAYTLSLTAAATLGTNWHITVYASGGDVTVDPNGSELINGKTTILIPKGQRAEIICDGAAFSAYRVGGSWELIRSGSFSGVTAWAATDLDPYRTLRIYGFIENVSSSTSALIRFSTDNGATYSSNTADYDFYASTRYSGPSTVWANGVSSGASICGGNFIYTSFEALIFEMNNPSRNAHVDTSGSRTDPSTGVNIFETKSIFKSSSVRNAIQIVNTGANNMSGFIILEGFRA